jgi:hypothetical protein
MDGDDSELLALVVDDEYLPDANPFVDAKISSYIVPLTGWRPAPCCMRAS